MTCETLVKRETTETWDNYQLRELNNGRLAMFASVGMLTHAYITGKGGSAKGCREKGDLLVRAQALSLDD